MSVTFNPAVMAFSGRRVREVFPVKHATVQGSPVITNKSSFAAKCNLATADLMGKIAEKFMGEDSNFPAFEHGADIPSYLCIIDTLQRLGVDRYFQSEIDTILKDTYRLWQQKEREIFSDIFIHAMAFRLLRVKGYEVSSEELAPYADQERIDLQKIDVATVIELYRATEERLDEEENSLKKLHAWTTTFLKQQLLTNSIPDKKLQKLVEIYLKNYHGILDRMGVRQNLDLYDISHYQTLKASDRFSNLRNEDFLAFARKDFNICQAQHQKELQQLQRWYADCRLDTLKYGRDVVRVANFLTSAILVDPELDDVRSVFAKHIILVTRIDDFFDHGGSREDSLDGYLSSSWVSIGCRICILMSMQFIGIKLSDEMLQSEECVDLCRHVSMVDRLCDKGRAPTPPMPELL